MAEQGKQIELSSDVKEIIAICVLGLIVYFFLVCRILCRAPPKLARGLLKDVENSTFVMRKPANPEGFYHGESEGDTIRNATEGRAGRLIVDRGGAKFQLGKHVAEIDSSNYGAFSNGESFLILEPTEDLLFHLDLFSGSALPSPEALAKRD
jgi:hypothetical protein